VQCLTVADAIETLMTALYFGVQESSIAKEYIND